MKTIQNLASIAIVAAMMTTSSSCKKDDTTTTNTTTVQPKTISCNERIRTNTTWADVNSDPNAVDYIINCWVNVDDQAILTVAPGVRIHFTSTNAGIGVLGESGLNMQGTADKPIVLEGVQHVPGEWVGVQIGSNNVNTIFDYVTFADAGSEIWNIVSNKAAALQISGDYWGQHRISKIQHCTFKNTQGSGIFAGIGAMVYNIGNNNFINNQKAPIVTDLKIASTLDNTNTFTGNAEQFVSIYVRPSGNGYTQDMTIKNIGIPYRVADGVTIGFYSGTYTIEPGVVFQMGANSFILTYYSGSAIIKAIGTATSPITFTGVQQIAGYWGGITICTNQDNRLEYCNFAFGGSADHDAPGSGHKANVFVSYFNNGRLTMHNCDSKNSATYGLSYRSTGCTVDLLNNTYSNNGIGDIEVY